MSGIPRGRGLARETEAVGPVNDRFVGAVLPFVLPPVAAMIQVQRLTGCRPGEVVQMRACDRDTSGAVWLFRPAAHKSGWRGKKGIIAIGPKAQAIIRQFLTTDTQACLFSPRRALDARSAGLRRSKKDREVTSTKQVAPGKGAATMEVSVRREGRAGDPRFLDGILDGLREEAKLLGTYAPRNIAGTAPAGEVVVKVIGAGISMDDI